MWKLWSWIPIGLCWSEAKIPLSGTSVGTSVHHVIRRGSWNSRLLPSSGIRKLAWARAMAGRWAVALPGNKRGFPSRVGRYSWIPLIARSGSSTWWEFFSLWRGSKGLREDFELQWMKHMLLSWDPVRWGGFRWCHKGGDDQTGH